MSFCVFLLLNVGFEWKLQIVNLGGAQVGHISKQWSGLTREFFTTADYFGISFPVDLDVRMKAVMLGAVMLIVIHEIFAFLPFYTRNQLKEYFWKVL